MLAGRPGTKLYISCADINIISVKMIKFHKVAVVRSVVALNYKTTYVISSILPRKFFFSLFYEEFIFTRRACATAYNDR